MGTSTAGVGIMKRIYFAAWENAACGGKKVALRQVLGSMAIMPRAVDAILRHQAVSGFISGKCFDGLQGLKAEKEIRMLKQYAQGWLYPEFLASPSDGELARIIFNNNGIVERFTDRTVDSLSMVDSLSNVLNLLEQRAAGIWADPGILRIRSSDEFLGTRSLLRMVDGFQREHIPFVLAFFNDCFGKIPDNFFNDPDKKPYLSIPGTFNINGENINLTFIADSDYYSTELKYNGQRIYFNQ